MRGKIYFFNLSIDNNRGLNYIKIKKKRSRCISRYISVLEIIYGINRHYVVTTLPKLNHINTSTTKIPKFLHQKIFRKVNCQNNYYILKSQIKFLDRFFNNLIKSSILYLKISKIIDF